MEQMIIAVVWLYSACVVVGISIGLMVGVIYAALYVFRKSA